MDTTRLGRSVRRVVRPRPAARRALARPLAFALILGFTVSACSFGEQADRDGLMTALQDVTGLTEEQAECSVDHFEDNADYAVDGDGNLVAADTPGSEQLPLDDVYEEVDDGSSDIEGLVPAFEQDLAEAVNACT